MDTDVNNPDVASPVLLPTGVKGVPAFEELDYRFLSRLLIQPEL